MVRQVGRGRQVAWACAVMLCIGVTLARGQEFRGSILGTVTDSTGGVLPGVSVSVANTETGVKQTVVTDGGGAYRVLYLNPGLLLGHGGTRRLQESHRSRQPGAA